MTPRVLLLLPKCVTLLSSTIDEEFGKGSGPSSYERVRLCSVHQKCIVLLDALKPSRGSETLQCQHIQNCNFSSRVNGKTRMASRSSILPTRASSAPYRTRRAKTSMPL